MDPNIDLSSEETKIQDQPQSHHDLEFSPPAKNDLDSSVCSAFSENSSVIIRKGSEGLFMRSQLLLFF